MTGTTPLGFTYPSPGDAPNVPLHMQSLATSVDTFLTGLTPNGKKFAWQFVSGVTTDAAGFLTVTHGLGFTPTAVNGTPSSPITGSNGNVLFGQVVADTFTSTTVRVRCLAFTGVQLASTTVAFSLFYGQ